MRAKFLKLDWVFIMSVLLLLGVGLLALYGISMEDSAVGLANFKKQMVSAFIGLGLMVFFSFLDYRIFSGHSTKIYFSINVALLMVALWGTTVRGTTGWIGLGAYHIQPVEIAKLALVIFLASFFSVKKTQLSMLVRIFASVVLIFIPIFLVLKQPDFGSAVIILGIWAAMLSMSGISKKNFFILLLIGVIGASSGWFFLKNYQKERLVNFIKPYNDPKGSGYNVIQSMIAVGSGRLTGKGLGHGSQSQLNFLPEKHTDFIFAVIAEDLGFVGAAFVLVLLGIIVFRIKETARLARDNFGYLIAVGVMVMIFLQVLVNVGMNTGIMPVTGVPLPFLSYGGSSLVVILAACGIIESIYLRRVKDGRL